MDSKGWSKIGWFLALWICSVCAVGAFASLIRLWIAPG